MRKVGWRILPFAMLLYFVSSVDRVNIGFAALAAGLFYAGTAATLAGVLLALTFVNTEVSAAKPPLWSMPGRFLGGAAAAAGIATINALGNLGGFVGPAMIGLLKGGTDSFLGGLYFVAALMLLSALLTLLLARAESRKALAELAPGP